MILHALTWIPAAISTALARAAAKNALHRTVGPSELSTRAVAIMEDWAGLGEEGGNNRGPWIRRWAGREPANWCAAVIGAAYRQAALELDQELPFELSLGAKRFGRNIGEAGTFVKRPAAGDVAVFHRGPRGSWKGHIRHVTSVDAEDPGLIHYIAGNEGRYPSKVRRGTFRIDAPDLVFYARV